MDLNRVKIDQKQKIFELFEFSINFPVLKNFKQKNRPCAKNTIAKKIKKKVQIMTFIQFNSIIHFKKTHVTFLSPFQLMDLVQKLMQLVIMALKLPNSSVPGVGLIDP